MGYTARMTEKIRAPAQKNRANEDYSSFKVRVYPDVHQEKTLNRWLYQVQSFRNEMVAFCQKRRMERVIWRQRFPGTELPSHLQQNDVQAASKYLTRELQAARKILPHFQALSGWEGKGEGFEFLQSTLHCWRNLTVTEKEELHHAHWLLFPRTILDQVLRDMEKTYARAFKDRKNPTLNKKAGFPHFRKTTYRYSIRFQVATKKLKSYCEQWEAGLIYIPALGSVLKFRDNRGLPKIPPEMLTLSRNSAGHYHLSFLNKDTRVSELKPLQSLPMTTCVVNGKIFNVPTVEGMDVSLKEIGVSTDGNKRKRIRYLKRSLKRLKILQKGLARKKKGSGRWKKNKKQIGKLHVHIANQREQGLRDLAQETVTHTAILCLEDLFIQGMMQNRNLAQSLADASLSRFKQLLKWEAQKRGHLVLECGRWDASSKTCSQCGHKYKELALQERTWTCAQCHTLHDRDINAAYNIRWMALQRHLTLSLSSSGNDEEKVSYRLHPQLEAFVAHGGLDLCLASYIPQGMQDKTNAVNFTQAFGEGKFDSMEVRVSEFNPLEAGAEKRH